MTRRSFTATAERDGDRLFLLVPFDPDEVWGKKDRHHVAGTVGGHAWRGPLAGDRIPLGPAWLRDCGVKVGDEVRVEIAPEGPQRSDLAPDVAEALEREPEAGAFFDSLAQFYRKGFLHWVDATKRRPEVRAERIDQMVELLKAGEKHVPR